MAKIIEINLATKSFVEGKEDRWSWSWEVDNATHSLILVINFKSWWGKTYVIKFRLKGNIEIK